MNNYISTALLFLLAFLVCQVSFPQSATKGKLLIEKKKVKLSELTVGKDEKISHRFVLVNNNAHPIAIKGVYPSCTCTSPEYSKVVPPRSKGFVTLKTDLVSVQNKMSVYAVIKSDAINDYQKIEIVNDKF